MRYEARLTLYDVMDQIKVAVVVTSKEDDDPGPPVKVLVIGRQYRSTGESDPRRWVGKALEELLRDL